MRVDAMSMIQQPTVFPAATPLPVPTADFFPISVKQYHELIDAGILTEDDPVELLEGYLVTKMPKKPSHSTTTKKTFRALDRMVPPGWHVAGQEPITTDTSEPEPDITVLRGDEDQFQDHHPGPQDVALLVEVADSTLRRDRGPKKRLYARVRIPVYWLINLVDHRIEVYTEPSGPAKAPDYHHREDFGPADMIPVVIEGREVGRIAVRDLRI
jgi:Uma2 family endonuclease